MATARAIRKHNEALLSIAPWLTDDDRARLLKKWGGTAPGICGRKRCPVCGKMRLVSVKR